MARCSSTADDVEEDDLDEFLDDEEIEEDEADVEHGYYPLYYVIG